LTTQSDTQPALFGTYFHRPVAVAFDPPDSGSDGGAVLVKAVDKNPSLPERLEETIRDSCQPGKDIHRNLDLLRQRIYAIAAGYPDRNDTDSLAKEPMHKLLLDRDPLDGQDLGSQPTLSRFEDSVTSKDLFARAEGLADIVVEHHARRTTIDLGPADDPTHGAQQLSFVSAQHHGFCYLPRIGTPQFDGENESTPAKRPKPYPRNSNMGPGTWPRSRRVVVQAEVVRFPGRDPRDNASQVVANVLFRPERVYGIHRGRGEVENRIQELQHGLEIDRASCKDCQVNQFRLLWTSAAYLIDAGDPALCRRHRASGRSGMHPAESPPEAGRRGETLLSQARHSSAVELPMGVCPALDRRCGRGPALNAFHRLIGRTAGTFLKRQG
jgi:hypothetical protein